MICKTFMILVLFLDFNFKFRRKAKRGFSGRETMMSIYHGLSRINNELLNIPSKHSNNIYARHTVSTVIVSPKHSATDTSITVSFDDSISSDEDGEDDDSDYGSTKEAPEGDDGEGTKTSKA